MISVPIAVARISFQNLSLSTPLCQLWRGFIVQIWLAKKNEVSTPMVRWLHDDRRKKRSTKLEKWGGSDA